MQNTPAIGDILTRPKALGFIKHLGVYLGCNRILQNTPEKGEHVSTVEEFSNGARVEVRRTGANPSNVMIRAWWILARPKKYNAIHRNCEHTASEIVHGRAVSLQLATIVVILVVAFLWILLLRR